METDDVAGDERAGLLERIRARQAGIEAYIQDREPASRRLSLISVVSSSVAAALMAGPAFGGLTFAETVQKGLALGASQTVWHTLCLGGLVVSVTAAVSAHLNKVTDLRSHMGAAQAASAMLEGLRTRLEFGRLPVQDAAQEYRDVVAGVPFIREGVADAGAGTPRDGVRSLPAGRAGAFSVWPMVVVVVLAGVLLLTALVGLVRGAAGPSTAGDAASPGPATTSRPADGSTPAPVPERGVFGGRTEQGGVSLAIVLEAGQAAAYLCDGDRIEAWLKGSAGAGRIDLTGGDGVQLTGTVQDGSVSGVVTTTSGQTPFVAGLAPAPAGVYEARIEVDGQPARLGWVVLPDGTQVGIMNVDGSRTGAPALDLADQTFVHGGRTHRAERFGP